MENKEKRSVRVDLDAETSAKFDRVKDAFNLQSDTETIRLLIGLVTGIMDGKDIVVPRAKGVPA